MKKHFKKAERGQSLVEFMLGAVVLILILSGILDLGRLYFVYVALEDGVGEAALFLSINPYCTTAAGGPDCADPNNAEYRARTSGGGAVDWSAATIDIQMAPYAGVGAPVSVTITYPYRLITPFVSQIANEIQLSVTATQTVISE